MCLGGKPKVQSPPVVQAPPSRDTLQTAAVDQRRRAREQQSTYGSVFTSVLGDPNYNTNVRSNTTVAAIGA